MTTRVGLTLGKYAPLHRGHQLVIETALAEVATLIILIYAAPETTPIPLSVRAQWLRELYPVATVLEAPDGPTVVGDTPEIKRLHEDYLFWRLRAAQAPPITHFYCSEFYGDHVSRALGAVNRLVDPARRQVPISGTLIRQNPAVYRAYLHQLVYQDVLRYQNLVLL